MRENFKMVWIACAVLAACLVFASGGAAQAANLVKDPGFNGQGGGTPVVNGSGEGSTWQGYPGPAATSPKYWYTYNSANGGNKYGSSEFGDSASDGLMGNGTRNSVFPGYDNGDTYYWGIWLYYDSALNGGLSASNKTTVGLYVTNDHTSLNNNNQREFMTEVNAGGGGGFKADDWFLVSGSTRVLDFQGSNPFDGFNSRWRDKGQVRVKDGTAGGWYYDNAYLYTLADYTTYGATAKPVSPIQQVIIASEWDGGAVGDDNWSNKDNWGGMAAPAPNDVLKFGPLKVSPPGHAGNFNNNTAGTQFNGITFLAGAPQYNLQGNPITLAGDLTNASSNNQTISLDMDVPNGANLDAGGQTLTLAGNITGNPASMVSKVNAGTLAIATGTITLNNPPATTNQAGGFSVSGGTLSMTGGLIDVGYGRFSSSAQTTMSGPSGAAAQIKIRGPKDDPGTAPFVKAGGRLDMSGYSNIDIQSDASSASGQDWDYNNGYFYVSNNVASSTPSKMTMTDHASVTGKVAWIDIGAQRSGGVLEMSGNSSINIDDPSHLWYVQYSGRVVVGHESYGYLKIQDSASITARSIYLSEAGGYNSVADQSGTGTLVTLNGRGMEVGRNGSGSYSISGGTLQVQPSGGYAGESGIVLGRTSNGVGILNISGTALVDLSLTSQSGMFLGMGEGSARLNLNGGTLLTPLFKAPDFGADSTVNFNGGLVKASMTNANFMPVGSGYTAIVNAGGALIHTNGQDITIAHDLTTPTGDGVTGVDTGLTPLPTNTFTGAPAVIISGGSGKYATGVANLNPDGTLASITITNPGVNYDSAPTITLSGGGLASPVSLTGTIAANTCGGLTKMGAGKLTLGGVNTFTGDTKIEAGALALANPLALQSSTVNLAAVDAGILDLSGIFPGESVVLGGLEGTRALDLHGVRLAVGNNDQHTSYAGVLSASGGDPVNGLGALYKVGSGTLTLAGTNNNTYSGGTVVQQGTLKIGSAGALPAGGDLTIEAGATVLLSSDMVAATSDAASASAVPEPGTILLLLAGAAALAVAAWRRRK